MAVTPVVATVTVTTAGTRVQVSSDTNLRVASVYFEADDGNTGYIFVGTSTVASTIYAAKLGVTSSVGQGFSITAPGAGGNYRTGGQGIQLSNLYVDSTVNGEKVQVTYVPMTGG